MTSVAIFWWIWWSKTSRVVFFCNRSSSFFSSVLIVYPIARFAVGTSVVKYDASHGGGFPKSAIREVTLLLALKHENIVDVKEVVIDDEGGMS